MGYMGLSCPGDSDTAADLEYDMIKEIVTVLKRGLNKPGNKYNTNGAINVGLILEKYFKQYQCWDECFVQLCNSTISKIEDEIKDIKNWDDEENALFHRKNYQRIKNSIKKILNHKENK
jgi:hypothetical protein